MIELNFEPGEYPNLIRKLTLFLKSRDWKRVKSYKYLDSWSNVDFQERIMVPNGSCPDVDEQYLRDSLNKLARLYRLALEELIDRLAEAEFDKVELILSGSKWSGVNLPTAKELQSVVSHMYGAMHSISKSIISDIAVSEAFSKDSIQQKKVREIKDAVACLFESSKMETKKGSLKVSILIPVTDSESPNGTNAPWISLGRNLFEKYAEVFKVLHSVLRHESDFDSEFESLEKLGLTYPVVEHLLAILQDFKEKSAVIKLSPSSVLASMCSVEVEMELNSDSLAQLKSRWSEYIEQSKIQMNSSVTIQGPVIHLKNEAAVGSDPGTATIWMYFEDKPKQVVVKNIPPDLYEVAIQAHKSSKIVEITGNLILKTKRFSMENVTELRILD